MYKRQVLFQDNYAVQEVLTEHVFSTTESYEFKLVLVNTLSNQSVVNLSLIHIYKFTDFVRIGLPLNIITFLISIFLIPLIWPF